MKSHARIVRLALSLLPVACLACLPAIAGAQIDPDPNGIGIYFDEAATRTSLTVAAVPGAPVELSAWLVATRVSIAGNIRYYSGYVEWEAAEAEVYQAMLIGWDQCWEMPVPINDGICVWVDPEHELLPAGDIVVLKRYDIRLWGDGTPVVFRLRPFRLSVSPEVSVDLHPSNGNWDLPVAVLNGPAPVAVESATWGAVKSLYR